MSNILHDVSHPTLFGKLPIEEQRAHLCDQVDAAILCAPASPHFDDRQKYHTEREEIAKKKGVTLSDLYNVEGEDTIQLTITGETIQYVLVNTIENLLRFRKQIPKAFRAPRNKCGVEHKLKPLSKPFEPWKALPVTKKTQRKRKVA